MRSVWALVRLLWIDYDHKNIEAYKIRLVETEFYLVWPDLYFTLLVLREDLTSDYTFNFLNFVRVTLTVSLNG